MPLAAPVMTATLFSSCIQIAPCRLDSFTPVLRQVEGHDTLVVIGSFEHLGMAQGANRVVIARAPVVLHAETREFVVLRVAFVLLRAVDELNQVVRLGLN